MAKSPDDRYPTCAEMAADAKAAVADRRLEDGVGPAPLPQALVVTADAPVPAAWSTVPPGVGAVPDSVPPSQGPRPPTSLRTRRPSRRARRPDRR